MTRPYDKACRIKIAKDLNVGKYHNVALFFIMLVLLGIDSQFAMVDVLVAAALDEYPHIFRKGRLNFRSSTFRISV